jgi:hypothetical protein
LANGRLERNQKVDRPSSEGDDASLSVLAVTRAALEQLPNLTLKAIAREVTSDAEDAERRIVAAASSILRQRLAVAA